MKITFDNSVQMSAEQTNTYRAHAESKYIAGNYGAGNRAAGNIMTACAQTRDISDNVMNRNAYDFSKSRGLHGWNAEDLKQNAGAENVSQMHNFMAVMSNSLSDEDFAKMQEDGYDPKDINAEDMVTILDTIKAELLKADVHVAGYTDSIDSNTLLKITGSQGYARQLSEEDAGHMAECMAAEDIPLTEENLTDAGEAWQRGQELTEMSDGSLRFMITNELAPTIDNLYLAQHSGAGSYAGQSAAFFKEDMPGYLGQKAADADLTALQEQMGQIVEAAGFPINEETLREAGFLVEADIPLNTDTFIRLHTLTQLSLPMDAEEILNSVTAAMAEGKPAGEADLTVQESIYRRAVNTIEDYDRRYEEIPGTAAQTPAEITAKRQLEEVRLLMTVEANVKLLKSGFSIDTAPIEETISALKMLENSQTGQAQTVRDAADLCMETLQKTREIPYMPAASIGRFISGRETLTIDGLYEAGMEIREAYRSAGEAYEAMFTEVRTDLGDNIRKAFQSVDTLLSELGLELTDENRKAVRSLSYNNMDVNEENIQKIKGASGVVARVVEKMTPMSVLKMIRDGVNPLQTSMEDLEEYLSGQDTYAEDSEKYSRFLYRLEQNNEITPEEKESFIGIYRLLRQVEKSDGAAIAKLVDTGAEVSFKNLLSAVRTGHVKGINVKINSEFGGLVEAIQKGVSIDSQIDSAYNQEILQKIREWGSKETGIPEILEQLKEPVTIQNITALQEINRDGMAPFKKIQAVREKFTSGMDGGESPEAADTLTGWTDVFLGETEAPAADNTDTAFTDKAHFTESYEELLTAYEEEAKELTFSGEAHSLDIKLLQTGVRQLGLKRAFAAQEEYEVPCMVGDELTSVHLKMIHDETDKGHFYVRTDSEVFGTLSGDFRMENGEISGMFTAASAEAEGVLYKAAEFLTQEAEEKSLKTGKIEIVTGVKEASPQKEASAVGETADLYKAAGAVVYALRKSLQTERTESYEN